MWLLTPEQAQALAALQRRRDMQRLAQTLGQAFPDVPGRVGERFAALVELGVNKGEKHGLTHLLALARYLGCWFMLGAEFETKPGFEWARRLLADGGRSQGAKVFQLCRRTRETLARPAAPGQAVPPMAAQAFDQAIATLDAALVDAGDLGALQRGGRLALGQACDIDALDLRPATPDATLLYAFDQGQWRRVPAPAQPAAVTLRAGAATATASAGAPAAAATPAAGGTPAGPPARPPRLSVLARPADATPTRLRLRLLAAHCCDPQTHPLVVHNDAQGGRDWRGEQTREITLDIYSDPPPPAPAGALQPALVAETAARASVLQLSSCGLRDDGEALGDLSTQIAAYPAEQHLVAWRREADAELSWPEPPGGLPPPPAPRCRIERDGTPLDATRWQAGLAEIDTRLRAALARLLTAWERTSGVTGGRLSAEPRVLCGDAALSWGWAAGAQGFTAPPFLRVAGRLELLACQLSLQFAGQLAIGGALCRVSLHSRAAAALQTTWERAAGDASPLPAAGQAAQTAFRQPFVLQLDALAQADAALLDCGPASGAVVGSCGLRPRADGQGLQWFATLAIEPVAVKLHLVDPLLGQQELLRPLLPAMPLLDWSLP